LSPVTPAPLPPPPPVPKIPLPLGPEDWPLTPLTPNPLTPSLDLLVPYTPGPSAVFVPQTPAPAGGVGGGKKSPLGGSVQPAAETPRTPLFPSPRTPSVPGWAVAPCAVWVPAGVAGVSPKLWPHTPGPRLEIAGHACAAFICPAERTGGKDVSSRKCWHIVSP